MDRPDSRIFASYPMPAKIDLLNERPRRESQVERQLANQIGQQLTSVPRITVSSEQQNFTTNTTTTAMTNSSQYPSQQQPQQQQQQGWSSSLSGSAQELNNLASESRGGHSSPSGRTEIKETRIIINQHSMPSVVSSTGQFEQHEPVINRAASPQLQQQKQQQQHDLTSQFSRQQYGSPQQQQHVNNQRTITTVTTTTTTNEQQLQRQQQQQQQQQLQQQQQKQPSLNAALNKTISNNAAILALELAEKEAKLMKEITALHERPYSPYQTPAKIDLTNESRAAQAQQQHAPPPTLNSRPNSRASNRSQTSQLDLMEKEAKLLREIEEIESKPYNPQRMLVEREQWFEYPENRPNERHLTESKRRVRDFCSMPSNMCQDRHFHEENLVPASRQILGQPTPGSIHTATIIRSPNREIDNKSPLPFAFDNFTTKGIRGNIASANAVEPDRPRPPIFPIVKRSPSPNVAHG